MWSNYGEIKEIKFEVKGGFPAIFDAIFSNRDPIMHCAMMSYEDSPHLHIVRESPKNVKIRVVREGRRSEKLKKYLLNHAIV